LREKTYWAQLCLVQLATADMAVAVDPLSPDLDLAPLFELMANPAVIKVFHAARQDLEIFHQLAGALPAPLFDSQVAAMVCGFGDSVSYETLAGKLAGARIDKSSRFTDWAQRPLSDKQITYALADVTHLRDIYRKLSARLEQSGRSGWLADEMAILTDPATYQADPDRAWVRLKPRNGSAKFLNLLQELAAWREREARARNLPRSWLLKDEAIVDLATQAPATPGDLARCRSLNKGQVEGAMGEAIMAAIRRGLAKPAADAPRLVDRPETPPGRAPLIELLKVLLKLKCEQHDVAQKLVANSADIEAIAGSDDAEVLPLTGWRREIFGADALDLKQGRLALTARGDAIRLVRLEAAQE